MSKPTPEQLEARIADAERTTEAARQGVTIFVNAIADVRGYIVPGTREIWDEQWEAVRQVWLRYKQVRDELVAQRDKARGAP